MGALVDAVLSVARRVQFKLPSMPPSPSLLQTVPLPQLALRAAWLLVLATMLGVSTMVLAQEPPQSDLAEPPKELSAEAMESFAFRPAFGLGETPKYVEPGVEFRHFDYVDPNAQRGGTFRLAAMGSFDKLNPFTLKGTSPRFLTELVFESLTIASLDEPASVYGLLANGMALAPDGLSVAFRLHPKARFSNGDPVLAKDVKASFDLLVSKRASPVWRSYLADVEDVEVVSDRVVRFVFARKNRELHLIVGGLPVFSKKWLAGKPFDAVINDIPMASGPYAVGRFQPGRDIEYVRRADYWGESLPTRRGQFNFDRVVVRYYQDAFVRLEAFKAGEFDFIHENTAKNWARSYSGPAFRSGRLTKTELEQENAAGLQAFFFNTRRAKFADVRVREALGLAMDYEWMNRQLFYNQYDRSYSYFSNTELAAPDGPPSAAERRLLKRISERTGKALPAALLGPTPRPPRTDGEDSLRDNLRRARALLEDAGWTYRNGALRNARGEVFEIELLINQRNWERVAAPYARNLEKLGIKLKTRATDSSLYKQRLDAYDFDMIVHWYLSGQNPGNELAFRFTQRSAKTPGEDNFAGVRDPLVDAAIAEVIAARSRDDLVVASHVLDRLLLHGHYAVPNWFNRVHRVAYRSDLQLPKTLPKYYGSEEWAIATGWWPRAGGN